jgi:hypothetical protein
MHTSREAPFQYFNVNELQKSTAAQAKKTVQFAALKKTHLPFNYKTCYLVCILLLLVSCRKDNSLYLIEPTTGTTNGGNCLIMSSLSADGSYSTEVKYDLDSVITESIVKENGIIINKWYLKIENPRQFIFLDGSKNLTDAKSRIYLNADGTLAKEILVVLNPDGRTFTEVDDEVNTFTYNEKKQVVSAIRHLGEDKGVFKFTYDTQNRIEKISVSTDDGFGILNYEKFTYESQAKNDNLLNVVLFESMSSNFLPSLRNVYIKSYTISYVGLPDLDIDTVFSYKFTSGKLSEVTETITALGFPLSWKAGVTLSCK